MFQGIIFLKLPNIGFGKKKCRICDRNLTLYLTYLELSDLSQIYAVLFANLLPFRRQRHYPPIITPPPCLKKTQTASFLLRPTHDQYHQERFAWTGRDGNHLV